MSHCTIWSMSEDTSWSHSSCSSPSAPRTALSLFMTALGPASSEVPVSQMARALEAKVVLPMLIESSANSQ